MSAFGKETGAEQLASSPERPVRLILVYTLARFARRLLTQVRSVRRLVEAQVRLISLTENFGRDATCRMMGSVVAIINERYAHDAFVFTRRVRRGNARKGYVDGGPVPFGYEARTVAADGKKDRQAVPGRIGGGGPPHLRSDAADQRRRSALNRVRRERVAAATRPGCFYGLVEDGLASARDALIAEHRKAIAQFDVSERSLSGQLAGGKPR